MPNLVATKTTSGLAGAEDLVLNAGELQHFMGEGNFARRDAWRVLAARIVCGAGAGQDARAVRRWDGRADVATLFELQHELQVM
ncbi:MAG: hypothetical protein U0869_04795 [Chloroflexota bacterium]